MHRHCIVHYNVHPRSKPYLSSIPLSPFEGHFGRPNSRRNPGLFPGLPARAELGHGLYFPNIWKLIPRGGLTRHLRFSRGRLSTTLESGHLFPEAMRDTDAITMRHRRHLHPDSATAAPTPSNRLPSPLPRRLHLRLGRRLRLLHLRFDPDTASTSDSASGGYTSPLPPTTSCSTGESARFSPLLLPSVVIDGSLCG